MHAACAQKTLHATAVIQAAVTTTQNVKTEDVPLKRGSLAVMPAKQIVKMVY